MLTKLTLTIDKDIVVKAKEYAQKEKRSISNIVSEYLQNLTTLKTPQFYLDAPITDSLSGMFKDNGQSYNTLLSNALSDKYLC